MNCFHSPNFSDGFTIGCFLYFTLLYLNLLYFSFSVIAITVRHFHLLATVPYAHYLLLIFIFFSIKILNYIIRQRRNEEVELFFRHIGYTWFVCNKRLDAERVILNLYFFQNIYLLFRFLSF